MKDIRCLFLVCGVLAIVVVIGLSGCKKGGTEAQPPEAAEETLAPTPGSDEGEPSPTPSSTDETTGETGETGETVAFSEIKVVNPNGVVVKSSTDDSKKGPISLKARIVITHEDSLGDIQLMHGSTVLTTVTENIVEGTSVTWKGAGHKDDLKLMIDGKEVFAFTTKTAGDINGDGFSDILVGATYTLGGHQDHAYVFLGGGTLAASADDANIDVRTSLSVGRLGSSVALGDINGDGYDDMIIGAREYNMTGCVFVYYGSKLITSQTKLAFDTNADELGKTMICGSTNGSFFGSATAVADVDGDGYGDLVVGARSEPGLNAEKNAGAIMLFYSERGDGLSTAPDFTYKASVKNQYMGWSLAAGDIDGDGKDEIVAGGRGSDQITLYVQVPCARGRVRVFTKESSTITSEEFMGSGCTDETIDRTDGFGNSVALITEGEDTLILVGDKRSRAYAVELGGNPVQFYTGTGGLPEVSVGTVNGQRGVGIAANNWFGIGPFSNNAPASFVYGTGRFGGPVSEIGDIDGDGTPDYAVGAEGADNNRGAIHINITQSSAGSQIKGATGTECMFGHAIAVSRMQ